MISFDHLATGAIVAALLADSGSATTTLHDSLATGSTLTVRTISGFVHVTTAPGPATVVARARSGDGSPIDMHVAQSRANGSWTVCEVPLAQRSCDRQTGVDHVGQHSRVDLTISVPAGVNLAIGTVSGDVSVAGVSSSVAAKSVSGAVVVATEGDARVETVSGKIVVRGNAVRSAKSVSGDLDVTTDASSDASIDNVSGNVKLAVPRTASVSVRAKTTSGDVRGSGSLRFSNDREFVGHDERAVLGGGARSIDVRTVSGAIAASTF